MKHLLDWKVGCCDSAEERPQEYFPATVPGAVQLDYAKHYGMPDYRVGENSKAYKWMEDKFWVYTAEFDAAKAKPENNLFFVAKGIDYKYDIYINGDKVCSYEGMYRKQILKLSGEKARLEIVIYPIPRSPLPEVHPDTRDEANQYCKPAVSYGWDFHPRLVPLGIWEEVYIEEIADSAIISPETSYKLSEDLSEACVTLRASGAVDAEWELKDPDGETVFSGKGEEHSFTLKNIKLWWCNGYGKQNLYTWIVKTVGGEVKSGKIGFRTIAFVKAPGSWDEDLTYPMTRNTPPITPRLNGVNIFAKGTNWVAPEIFYGTINYDRYREQLELVAKARLNYVRCWGGAIVNKDSFFEICDELGILVWQEFPLACNHYVGTDAYIDLLTREATDIIDRIKSHPSLFFWCGGNELFNNWSVMTEQHRAIRLLGCLTFEKTPELPFLPTSPVMGMAHGGYSFHYPDGREVIQVLPESHFTAYTEIGVPGYSTMETLMQFAKPEEIFPLDKTNKLASHHGSNWPRIDTERYFGKAESLEEMVSFGQMIQSTGYQFIYEEARRQKPYCSMVSNWCFNEPWPNMGNNSLVCYPNSIKPAFYAVAAACRSVLASARYRRFVYIAGETLDFDVYLLNDSLEKVSDGSVKISVRIGDREEEIMTWDYKNVAINTNVQGPTVRYSLPVVEDADTVEIILDCGEYSSKYTLIYRLPEKPANAPRKMNAILNENKI